MRVTNNSIIVATLILVLNLSSCGATAQEVSNRVINIDTLTVRSLLIWQLKGKEILGSATGFVVENDKKKYLVTNWHVVSGKHPVTNQITDKNGRIPDSILLWHHGKKLGKWEKRKNNYITKKVEDVG